MTLTESILAKTNEVDRTTYGDWIGKVVEITDQKMQSQGFGWGWRYKVRIQGTFPRMIMFLMINFHMHL